MKILVIYASAGRGHQKAAEVIHGYLKEKRPQDEIRLIDALDYSTAMLKASYDYGYGFLINHAQWLWFIVFYLSALKLPFGFSRHLYNFMNRRNAPRLYEFLAQEDPDAVISTHFLPSQVTACLKRSGMIKSKLITVITDFGVHPFWVSRSTDLYACASEATRQALLRMKVPAENIRVTGIPVDPIFAPAQDKKALCERLGIEYGTFTVLLVTGSFGIGPLEKIAELLSPHVQVLVVCAKNKKLLNRLAARSFPRTRAFGFVGNMHELMAVSDVIVTKPGGLSISELLVMELVPVFISAIPGQETGNVRALSQEGVGTYCRSAGAVYRSVLFLQEHPRELERARELIKKIRKPESVAEIADALRTCCPGPTR